MKIFLTLIMAMALLACGQDAADTTSNSSAPQEGVTPPPASQPLTVLEVPEDYEPAFPELENKRWVLSSYEYKGRSYKPEGGHEPTLRIVKDQASGKGGCNNYTAEVEVGQDGGLSIANIASTKMLCQGKMTFESQFFELLKNAQSYSVNKAFLEVECEGGKLSFRYTFLEKQ